MAFPTWRTACSKREFGTSTQYNTPQEHPMPSPVCDYIFVCFQRFWECPKLSSLKRPQDRMIDTATTMQYSMAVSEKNSASYYSSSSSHKSRRQRPTETCIAMFAKTLLTVAKKWKQPNVYRWTTEQTDWVSLHLHIMEHQSGNYHTCYNVVDIIGQSLSGLTSGRS